MALPKTFTAGERLFASDLNDNFNELDGRTFPKVATGSVSVTSFSSEVFTSAVTFPSGLFSAAPNVVCSLDYSGTTSQSDTITVLATSVTSSGFTIRVTENETTDPSGAVANWVAVEA
jgi:hypothetical protein